jgi:hypothetical protein
MADNGAPGGILSQLSYGVRAINSLATVIGKVFPAAGGTSTTATAGSATLPANPVGFIDVTLPDGTAAKVPFYGS